MKKILFSAILLLAPLMIAAEGYGAKISWTLPISYADGTPIDPADVGKIVVEVYSGPTEKGPWKWIAASLPGATAVTVPDPPAWQTLWYTVRSTLQGAESAYAIPVSKTNRSIPSIPFTYMMKKIAKKMMTMKKMIFLLFLVLLACLIGFVWYRGKRGKG
jgi:hypothetical protein